MPDGPGVGSSTLLPLTSKVPSAPDITCRVVTAVKQQFLFEEVGVEDFVFMDNNDLLLCLEVLSFVEPCLSWEPNKVKW